MSQTNSELVNKVQKVLRSDNNFIEIMSKYHSLLIDGDNNTEELRQTIARDIEIHSAKIIIEIKQLLGCESV